MWEDVCFCVCVCLEITLELDPIFSRVPSKSVSVFSLQLPISMSHRTNKAAVQSSELETL
jgi:hypothetical protein